MSRRIRPARFALRQWTIQRRGEKFYIAPAASFDTKATCSKGYKSLQAACAAIARKHAEEWTERNARYVRWCAGHGLSKEAAR